MNNRVAGRLAAASIVALAMGIAAAPAHAKPGEKIANSYICVFKNDRVAKNEVRGRSDAAAKAHGGNVKFVYTNAVRGFSANMSEQAVTAMRRANPTIAYCEQDQVMGLPPISIDAKPGGGGSTPPAQSIPWGVTRVKGGAANTFKTAWVIDSGVDLDHPDLNVDLARSANFVGRETTANDLNGHGTHVAGTIAAINNAYGVVGVAPGASVVAVRVLDRRGSGSTSGVIAGIDHVARYGASGDVANMSLGGGVSSTLDTAVINAAKTGVRFALAAGNEADDADNHSPARAEGTNIFTVAAFAKNDIWASYSNYGSHVDWAEPGTAIPSTWKDGGYSTISGTSMATPHLAGILLWQAAPTQNGSVTRTGASDSYKIGVVQ